MNGVFRGNITTALHALAASGTVRLRQLDDGRYRIARPAGHNNVDQVEIDPQTGKWTERRTGEEGDGFFSCCHRLGIEMDEAAGAMAPARYA